MSKLLVELYLPAALRGYDIKLPADVPLYQSLPLIGQAVSRLTAGLYAAGETPVLIDGESGMIFNIDMTPRELGLRNGSRLMLI